LVRFCIDLMKKELKTGEKRREKSINTRKTSREEGGRLPTHLPWYPGWYIPRCTPYHHASLGTLAVHPPCRRRLPQAVRDSFTALKHGVAER